MIYIFKNSHLVSWGKFFFTLEPGIQLEAATILFTPAEESKLSSHMHKTEVNP